MTAVAPPPSGTGCVECLDREDGWWFHLRRCVECGHVGCCDASLGQHASKQDARTLAAGPTLALGSCTTGITI